MTESGTNLYFLNYPPTDSILPSVLLSLASFLADLFRVIDGYCFKPKPINSGVPQGSVLSPTLFLLFSNDLSITDCPIQSYADDSTLHYSTTFKSRPSRIELHNARLDATERLASGLFFFSF